MEFISKKLSQEQAAQVDQLAATFEAPMQNAIANLIRNYSDFLNVDELVKALQSGNEVQVISIINSAITTAEGAASGAVVQNLKTVAVAAGTSELASYAATSAVVTLNQYNPLVISWATNYAYDLIQQVNGNTLRGIRQVVASGLKEGISPFQQATQIKAFIGLTDKQAQAVMNYKKDLETVHLRRSMGGWGLGKKIDKVNGHQVWRQSEGGGPKDGINVRRLRDFRFDKQVQAALSSGKPLTPEQIDKMVNGYVKKYLTYRTRNIARTESLRATNQGIQLAFQNAVDRGQFKEEDLTRTWIVANDERKCPICAAIPNMNPNGVGLNEPFKTPRGVIMIGPEHPGCRCTIFIYPKNMKLTLSSLANAV